MTALEYAYAPPPEPSPRFVSAPAPAPIASTEMSEPKSDGTVNVPPPVVVIKTTLVTTIYSAKMPLPFQVTVMFPPLGVTGRPVTPVSMYATSGLVADDPVST